LSFAEALETAGNLALSFAEALETAGNFTLSFAEALETADDSALSNGNVFLPFYTPFFPLFIVDRPLSISKFAPLCFHS